MTKVFGKKTSPDSAFRLSVATVEEQGILESFFKLPQTERGIIRQLLEKCGPQQVGVIRLPVPFGPKEFTERRNFLLPVVSVTPSTPIHRRAFLMHCRDDWMDRPNHSAIQSRLSHGQVLIIRPFSAPQEDCVPASRNFMLLIDL